MLFRLIQDESTKEISAREERKKKNDPTTRTNQTPIQMFIDLAGQSQSVHITGNLR